MSATGKGSVLVPARVDDSADDQDDVTAALRAAILDGEYAPGHRLVEADLCSRFAASRFIVRAALTVLRAEGLVAVQRNRGASVRKISLDEAVEITEVRRLLEAMCAERAAQRAGSRDRTALRSTVRDMRAAVREGQPLAYRELNTTLHYQVRELAAHATAARLLEQLRGQMARHQLVVALGPGRTSASLPEHEAIVKAIVAADPAAAAAAMSQHSGSIIEVLQSLRASGHPLLPTDVVPS